MAEQLNIVLDGKEVIKGVEDTLAALRELKAQITAFAANDPTGRVRAEVQALSTSAVTVVQTVEKTLGGVHLAIQAQSQKAEREARASGKRIGKAMSAGLEEAEVSMTVKAERQRIQAEYEKMVEMGAKVKIGALQNLKAMGVSLFPEDRARLKAAIEDRAGYLKQLQLQITEQQRLAAMEGTSAADRAEIVARAATGLMKLRSRLAAEGLAQEQTDANRTFQMRQRWLKAEEAQALEAQAIVARASKGLTALRAKMAAESNAAAIKALSGTAQAQVNLAMGAPVGPFQMLGGSRHGLLPPGAKGEVDSLSHSMRDAHSAARGLASGFNAMWLTWGNLGPLLAGAAVSNAFVQSIKRGAEFEKTMETIGYVAGTTSQDLERLTKTVMGMGEQGPYGPNELAKALKTLALAGLDAEKQMQALRPVMNFAVVGEMPLDKAAESLVAISTAFGYTATGFSTVGDVIAKAAAISMSSIESMTESFRTASTVAQQYGVSVRDAATTLALLSQVGIKGTAAGTAMRNMYTELIGSSKQAQKVLKETLNLDVIDNATKAVRPLADILRDLTKSLSGYDFRSQIEMLQKLGNERGMKALAADMAAFVTSVRDSGKDVTSELARIQQELADAPGFVAIAAAGMMSTTSNQMKSVGSALETALVKAFNSVNTEVQVTSKYLKDLFNSAEFQQGLQSIIGGVAQLTRLLVENHQMVEAVALGYITGKAALIGFELGASLAAAATALLSASALKASVSLRVMLASLGPIGAMLAIAGTAWLVFGDHAKEGASKASEAAAAHSSTVIEGLDKEIARLDAQMEARRAELDTSIAARKVESDLAISRLQALHTEERAVAQVAHQNLLLQRSRIPEGETYKILAAEESLENSRLRIADLVLRQTETEDKAYEKQRILMNKARQDAREAEQAAQGRRQVNTGPRKFTQPDFAQAAHEYANELREINLIVSANARKAASYDEAERVREAVLKNSYDTGVLSFREYQDQLSEIQSAHERQRLDMATQEQALLADKLQELTQKAGGLKPNSDASQRLANDIEAVQQRLFDGQQKIAKLSNDGYLRQLNIQRDMLKPAADLLRNEQQVEAALKNNFDQEMARLSVKENIVLQSEREQYVQAEILKSTNAMEDRLQKLLAERVRLMQEFDFAAADLPESAQSAYQRLSLAIIDLQKLLSDARGTAATVANQSFDAKKINEISKSLSEGIADAILSGGEEGGAKLRDVLEAELLRKPLRTVIQAFLQPITNGIAGSVWGMVGGGGAGAAGGTMSTLSGLGGLSSIGAGLGGGNILGAGAASTMSNGLISGFGANMANIGTLLEGGSFLTAASAAMPYLAVAGLVVSLLDDVFGGGGGPKVNGFAASNSALTGYRHAADSEYTPELNKTASAAVQSILASYLVSTSSLGVTPGDLQAALRMGSDPEGDAKTHLFAYATLNGQKVYDRNNLTSGDNALNNALYEDVGRSPEELAEAIKEASADAVLFALQATDMPARLAEYFAGLDPLQMTSEEIDEAVKAAAIANSLWKAFSQMGPAMARLAALGVEDMTAFARMAGGIDALKASLSSYYDNFFSSEEKRAATIRSISETLTLAGVGMSDAQVAVMASAADARTQFRNLVEAQTALGPAGQEAVAALLSVSGAFASITPALDAAADSVNGYSEAVSQARSDLERAYEAEKSTLESLRDRMEGFTKKFKDFRDSLMLGGLSPLTPGQKYAEAANQFQAIRSAIAGGPGSAGYFDALERYDSVATAFLEASRVYNASGSQYQSDFAMVIAATEHTTSLAELEYDVAVEQLHRLDQQVAGLIDIKDAVMSVAEAIAALAALPDGLAGGTGQNSPTSLVTQLYADLFHKTPDAEGLSFWTNRLSNGTPLQQIRLEMIDSARIMGYPGYATGGLGSGLTMVGEHGMELVDFETPSRIYNAAQTAGMFAQNSSLVALVSRLVEQNEQLTARVEELTEQNARGMNAIVQSNFAANQQAADRVVSGVGEKADRERWNRRSRQEAEARR